MMFIWILFAIFAVLVLSYAAYSANENAKLDEECFRLVMSLHRWRE